MSRVQVSRIKSRNQNSSPWTSQLKICFQDRSTVKFNNSIIGECLHALVCSSLLNYLFCFEEFHTNGKYLCNLIKSNTQNALLHKSFHVAFVFRIYLFIFLFITFIFIILHAHTRNNSMALKKSDNDMIIALNYRQI